MHGIIQPIDRLFSIQGTEWHGLAEHVEFIDENTVAPLLFPILTSPLSLNLGMKHATADEAKKAIFGLIQKLKDENGEPLTVEAYSARIIGALRHEMQMTNHKAIVADYRECRPELIGSSETSGGCVPLHVPKDSYQEITNRQVWEATMAAIKDVDAKVSCVGTLEAGKKFFTSIQLGDGGKFCVKRSNGAEDCFFGNLNMITSHDGTLAVEAYDSLVRIVCMNTLRASRSAAGDVGFKVYHSKNADFAMANLGDLINRILTGRAEFVDQMGYLDTLELSLDDARALVVGYLVEVTNVKTSDATKGGITRRTNVSEEILRLFIKGSGNEGKTAYDLLNGVTEYYTHGEGTGKDSDLSTRAYKANFGRAADHKNAFANLLLSDARRAEVIELGRENKLP